MNVCMYRHIQSVTMIRTLNVVESTLLLKVTAVIPAERGQTVSVVEVYQVSLSKETYAELPE